ncbi:hypothetical protein B0H34DRAFT_798974 [Crassisporium funariophilum]|nr:hypothetical protein B0H34DRAFT_798974 [Crassisporium funariophilum]
MAATRKSKHRWASIVVLILLPIAIVLVALLILTRIFSYSSQAASGKVGLHFSPARVSPVAMIVDTTAHYQLDAEDSSEEFFSLLPSGGHAVYVADESGNPKKHTVTLFHQLKCLDIIRREYIRDPPRPVPMDTQHCMNYLHQTLLCNLNTGVESTKNALATASRSYQSVCKDWTEVYKEAERNQQAYREFSREKR